MKNLIRFIILLSPCFGFSQLENTQWRFGYQCGLSFTTNPPAIVLSANLGGNCSDIADASGNLLFYTDGMAVYNRFDVQMAGSPLNTSVTGTQGVLIAKQPGNNPYYYIFISDLKGVRYSIVDMSLAAGAGSLTTKNVTLTSQAQTFKVAGTRHCNKSDIWIISQDSGATSWRTYLLTGTGLTGPIVSNTGHTHYTYATMKFSPDGSKIATTEWWDGVYLHDFNNSTGAVSGMTVVSGSGLPAWGVEFSPDGKKLYATRNYKDLLQWDLTAGSASAIAASLYTVYSNPLAFSIQGALQLAPDGKIYQMGGIVNAGVLSCVNNPNGAGAACSYSYGGLNFSPKIPYIYLPNQVKPPLPRPSFTSSINQSSCQPTFQFGPATTTVGGVNSLPTTAANWIFGDPASGPANYSSQLNPVHVFSGPGTYTVKMIVANSCSAPDTISQVVNVPNPVSTLSFSGNTLICMGETTTLSVNGASTYTWNSALGQATGTSVVINPTTPVTFTVSSQNVNACITESILTVSILPPSIFTVSGPMKLCSGESVTLTANGVNNYTWTSSSGPVGTASVLTISPPKGISNYTVSGFNPSLTCVGQLLVTVTVNACVGLSSNHTDAFNIYPNPFQDQLEISSHIRFKLTLYDLHGRLVYTGEGTSGINAFDLSYLAGGAYALVIQSPEGTTYRKIVKFVSP